jgi:NADPH:quinone reductase-like Zn-dependent oxidoreductase
VRLVSQRATGHHDGLHDAALWLFILRWRTFTLSQPAAIAANRVELFAMYERGAIAPVITAALPLDRVAGAIARLQDRSAMGKVVVMI